MLGGAFVSPFPPRTIRRPAESVTSVPSSTFTLKGLPSGAVVTNGPLNGALVAFGGPLICRVPPLMIIDCRSAATSGRVGEIGGLRPRLIPAFLFSSVTVQVTVAEAGRLAG